MTAVASSISVVIPMNVWVRSNAGDETSPRKTCRRPKKFTMKSRASLTLVTAVTLGVGMALQTAHGTPLENNSPIWEASLRRDAPLFAQATSSPQIRSVSRETTVVFSKQVRIEHVNCNMREAAIKASHDRREVDASIAHCNDETLLIAAQGNGKRAPKLLCSSSRAHQDRCNEISETGMSRVIRISSANVDLPVGLAVEIYRLPASPKFDLGRISMVAEGEIIKMRWPYLDIYADRLLESNRNYRIRIKAATINDKPINDSDW